MNYRRESKHSKIRIGIKDKIRRLKEKQKHDFNSEYTMESGNAVKSIKKQKKKTVINSTKENKRKYNIGKYKRGRGKDCHRYVHNLPEFLTS